MLELIKHAVTEEKVNDFGADDQAPTRPHRRSVDTRSPWLNPQFLAQMITIVILLASGFLALYGRQVKIEAAADSLKATSSGMDAKVSQISSDVSRLTNGFTGVQKDIEALRSENTDLKERTRLLETWMQAANIKLAELKGERRR